MVICSEPPCTKHWKPPLVFHLKKKKKAAILKNISYID